MKVITTLFLDRDGVINKENEGDYIRDLASFELLPGVVEALQIARKHFDYIIVVTNQRGIGRGLMQEVTLHAIHDHMLHLFQQKGVNIDKIYFAPFLDKKHPYRKPNIGMALHAKEDFPAIDFAHAIMVGNNISDMVFGKTAGMQTVFLHTTQAPQNLPHDWIDHQFPSLLDWAKSIENDIS